MDKLPCENCITLGMCLGVVRKNHGEGWSPYGTAIELRGKCSALNAFLQSPENNILVSDTNREKYHEFFQYFHIKMIDGIALRKKMNPFSKFSGNNV